MINFDEKVVRQIIDTLRYYENPENIEDVPIDILRLMLKEKEKNYKSIKK